MEPIRLRVNYRTPQGLISQLTRGVGKGGVQLEAARPVAEGTTFIIELAANEVEPLVKVSGTVVSVNQVAPDRWLLRIRYAPPDDRAGIDAMLDRIFDDAAMNRANHRIPLQLRVVDQERPHSPIRLRDLSIGGLGLDFAGEAIPEAYGIGAHFVFQLRKAHGSLLLHSEVSWRMDSDDQSIPHRLGAHFNAPSQEVSAALERILRLEGLPAPPWVARISFPKSL